MLGASDGSTSASPNMEGGASALGRLRDEHDDDANVTKRAVSMWPVMPPRPKDFLQGNITFELGLEEAQFLADCIRRTPSRLAVGGLVRHAAHGEWR